MKRSTLIAIVVFVILLAGAVFTLTRSPERGISRVSFATVGANTIDRVEIAGKNPVVLVKEGEAWRVEGGKLADSNLVKPMVESISKMTSSDLTSKDKKKYAEMEVDDERGVRVKAIAGKNVVAEFVVGKGARGGSYVRIGDAVYMVPQVYASTFSHEASQWLDKKLFDDKIDEVTRLEVALAGAKPYALVKRDNAWAVEDANLLPKGFRFDSNAARALVSTITTIRAKDVLDDPGADKTQFDKGDAFAYIIEQGSGDAKTTTRRELELGTTLADNSVYAQASGRTDVFTLPEYTVKNLRKLPTDFRDLKMIDLDQSKVVKLTITKGKERLVLDKQGGDWKITSSSEKIPENFNLDSGVVTRRISALANVRAAKAAEQVGAAAAGLNTPWATVVAMLDNKKAVTLSFGKTVKEDNQDMIYARGNADALTYLVSKWTRDDLAGTLNSFAKTADSDGLANLDPKQLSGLPADVREGLMRQIEQKKLIEQLQKQAAQHAPSVTPNAQVSPAEKSK